MATTLLFVSGKVLSFKNDGTPNAGGKLYFFSPGTSTPKTTYTTKALSVANAHPVILDAAGRASVYFSGDADVTVTDSADVTLYTQANVNPPATSISQNFTSETTLDSTHNGKWLTTTANIVLPTAISVGTGWQVNLKNLATTSIIVSRTGSGDTLNNAAASLTLPENESLAIIVNDGITGYDIFFNPLLEVGTGIDGQVLGYTNTGPAWQTADLINAGNDLYLYNNFT
jgi:hypothetical protein